MKGKRKAAAGLGMIVMGFFCVFGGGLKADAAGTVYKSAHASEPDAAGTTVYINAAANAGTEPDAVGATAYVNAANAGAEPDLDTSILDEVDFTELDGLLEEQEATRDFDFKGLVKQLISGEEIDKERLFGTIRDAVLYEVAASRGYMLQMVLLVAAFALLYNFTNVFEHAAVTDISFYIVYMLLLALLLKSFQLISGVLSDTLGTTLDFMRALMPAFCLTMVFSTGTVTAMGFYQLTLFLLYIIEAALIYGVLPAVHIYVMLELVNHLTREEMISRLTELILRLVEWTLKFLFTLVVGINVVQGLLSPVIDGFKTTMFSKTVGMLPGLGASAGAVAEVMVGSGIIIKNGVGIAGILVVLLLCAGPLLKVGIMTLMYKLSAAVVQPIADKRMAGCINGMGEGARLLGKVLVTADVMLLLTIALVTAATTWNR